MSPVHPGFRAFQRCRMFQNSRHVCEFLFFFHVTVCLNDAMHAGCHFLSNRWVDCYSLNKHVGGSLVVFFYRSRARHTTCTVNLLFQIYPVSSCFLLFTGAANLETHFRLSSLVSNTIANAWFSPVMRDMLMLIAQNKCEVTARCSLVDFCSICITVIKIV
jgi:uncharacterized membrane protein